MRPLVKASYQSKKLGVSSSTLYNWVKAGLYPGPNVRGPGKRGMGLWYAEVADAWQTEYEYQLDQGADRNDAARAATKRADELSSVIRQEVVADRERLARRRERGLTNDPLQLSNASLAAT